jgi:tetratricopeptide (TPR) repeat protein
MHLAFKPVFDSVEGLGDRDPASVALLGFDLTKELPSDDPEWIERANRFGWLAIELALHGSKVWDRIVKSLPASQADIVRQQFDALSDQFTLAGHDDSDVGYRQRLFDEIRAMRHAGPEAAISDPLDADSPLGRLCSLQSLEKQSLVGQVLRFFYLRERPSLAGAEAVASRVGDEIPLACRNLNAIVQLLPEREVEWAEMLDGPDAAVAEFQPRPSEAEQHFRRGVERLQSGEYRQAIAQFTSGLKIDSTHAELYAQRGDAFRLLGEAQRALSDYHIALHLNPSALMPLLGRASAYRDLGDFDRARADADAVIELNRQQPLAYRIRASAAVHRGDLDAALDALSAAITLDPDDSEALQQRGQILIEFGNDDKAIRDFNRVLDLKPQHVAAYFHRANARRSRGDYLNAVRDYNEVLRHHPGNALALTFRGLAHELNGDRERALADHTEALRLEPENVSIYFSRAKLCRVMGDWKGATADLDNVLQRQPDHVAALYHRAKIALQKSRWDQALADLEVALAVNPALAVAYVSRAVVRDFLSQFADARADADKAVELEPNSAVNYVVRGLIAAHVRDTAAALADFNEAIRLDDRFPIAYQERSVAWTLQGDYDRALDDANKLIALEPGNAQGYAHRSMLLHLLGKVQSALIDYSKAMQLDPRVILSGWHQPLAEHGRNQTARLLGDAIDALRFRRNFPGAPEPQEWTIVVEMPRPTGEAPPVEKKLDKPTAPSSKVDDQKPASVAESINPGSNEGSKSVTAAPATPASSSITAAPTPAPALTESPATAAAVKTIAPNLAAPTSKQSADTMLQSSAQIETASDAPAASEQLLASRKPAKSSPDAKTASPPSTAKPQPKAKKLAADAEAEWISPVKEGDISIIEEATDFNEVVDRAIEKKLAGGPDDVKPPAPAINTAPAAALAVTKPAAPSPAPSPVESAKPIDCPLCRHRLPPAETLSGGRFRCGNCNAIFFPGAGAPSATSFPSSPKATRPAKQAAKQSHEEEEEDDEPTWLQKWKKPTPLACTGVLALVLLYFFFPTSLFGHANRYALHQVKGQVTFEGKPIPNASLVFYPVNPKTDNHPRPKAVAGSDGLFKLGSYAANDGAPAGEYKVAIAWNTQPTQKEIQEDRYRPKNQLPARYANPESSGLTARIVAGDNSLPAFALKK